MMIKNLIIFFKKPYNLFIFSIFYIFLIPLILSLILVDSFNSRAIYFAIFFLVNLFITDFIFLFIYRLNTGHHYKFIKKKKFEKLHVEPHPYLPYVFKKNFWRQESGKIEYPLNKNVFFPDLKSNNLGYYNGEKGNRDVITPKPNDLIRINCLGGSTTGNYFKYKDKNYSYPLELERILKKKFTTNFEVNNFGQGGYNSADILVRYAIESIDTKPDYIIIYHAYNDIRSYLTKNFSSDYSHSRRNLGEVYWKYQLGSKIPNIKVNFLNYITNKYLFPIDERSTILEMVGKQQIDPSINYFPGLATYERNIQSIIDLSLKNNVKVILSTFCMYLYPEIQNDPLHALYKKIVDEENKIVKKLAEKNDLILVDSASLIPLDNNNFLDTIHFSIKGMNLLADCISKKISL